MTEQFYYGIYQGVVTGIKDPEKRGRITVKCPDVLGDETESAWCDPVVPVAYDNGGDFCIPAVGETVWVMFIAGDVDYPVWLGNWWSEKKTPLGNNYKDADTVRVISYGNCSITMKDGEIKLNVGEGEWDLRITDGKVEFKGESSGGGDIDELEEELSQVKSAVNSLSSTVNGISTDLDNTKTGLSTLGQSLTNTNTELGSVKSDLESTSNTVNSLSNRVNELSSSFNTLNDTIKALQSTVTTLGNKVETLSNKYHVDDIQVINVPMTRDVYNSGGNYRWVSNPLNIKKFLGFLRIEPSGYDWQHRLIQTFRYNYTTKCVEIWITNTRSNAEETIHTELLTAAAFVIP